MRPEALRASRRRCVRARSSSPSLSIVSMAASAAAHASGLPPKVPPRPPGWTVSIRSARPVTAAMGRPPPRLLAVVTMSGTTPSCSHAYHAPVRPNPDWISSATNTTPLASAPRRRAPRASPARAPRTHPRPRWAPPPRTRWSAAPTMVSRTSMVCARVPGAPEGIGVRRPVHLGREGAEPRLVGHGLAREAQAQQRPPVEAVVEGDDPAPAGGVAGHLHGVLDGLGPGVHEERPLLVHARCELR